MSKTIEPTVGRIVWYRHQDGAIRAAIVVGVNSTFNLNLYVFGYSSSDLVGGMYDSVTHAVPEQEPGCMPSWHWMPYQKQQAEKHANAIARANEPKLAGTDASEVAIEREIQAKGLTAPRLSPADLDANIAHVEAVKHVSKSGQVLRWAILTAQNGFAVVGKPSVAVSPANDNAEIGEKVAIDNSRAELWPLMGYALKQQLHLAAYEPPALGAAHAGDSTMQPHQQRVVDERAELDEKLSKLNAFIDGVMFSTLDADEQDRLKQQAVTMATYSDILSERIAAF